MKKSLRTILVLFGLLLLAGCSFSKQTAIPGTTTVTAMAAETATPTALPVVDVDLSKLKGMQVFFMYPWAGDTATLMDSLVKEFNQTNSWGIQVVEETPGSASSLNDALSTDLQNSTPPEIIVAPIEDLLALNANKKTVVDLTPYVNSAKWGLGTDNIQNYLPTFWNQDEVNGYRYGIPAERTAKVLIYNKTWANELGFSNPPTTMDDFQTQVCAAHTALKQDSDSTNDGLGGWIVDTDALTTASWAVAFGAPLQTDGKMTFSTPGTVNAMSYLRNLLDLGCAWNSKDSSPYSYFASRQALVYSADLQDIPLQQATLNIAGSKDEWMIIPYPTQGKTFILTQGPSYAILATSAEKRLASWLFIRWMSNADHIGSLVKASTTLPLGEKIIPYAIELEDSYPQWTEAVNLLQDAQLPPVDANWTTAKMIWEDAGWQLFKMDVKADQISDLTKQMDQTYSDLVGKAK